MSSRLRLRRRKSREEEERPPVQLTETEQSFIESWKTQPMRKPHIEKVSVNFAVGRSGPDLEKARTLCQQITNQVPAEGRAKESVRGFGIRKHEPIGVFSTLRGELAQAFLKKAFYAVEEKVATKNFDRYGNLSFGIDEHLKLPDIKYDPQIGVHGFNTTIVMGRPGYRTKLRRIRSKKISSRHKLTKEESIAFFKHEYNLEVE
ncbi:MAG: 50S ribosomal protein L5 [Candidatus Heimdallarchaeota archaeon]